MYERDGLYGHVVVGGSRRRGPPNHHEVEQRSLQTAWALIYRSGILPRVTMSTSSGGHDTTIATSRAGKAAGNVCVYGSDGRCPQDLMLLRRSVHPMPIASVRPRDSRTIG